MLYTPLPSYSIQRIENTLPPALGRLQRVLAADCPGNDHEWAGGVWHAVSQLERKLRLHLEDGKAADGIPASIDLTRPSLIRQWDGILQEYANLLETVIALKWELYHLAQGQAMAATARGLLRQRVEKVLSTLQHDLEAETDIIMESVVTDIGVGD